MSTGIEKGPRGGVAPHGPLSLAPLNPGRGRRGAAQTVVLQESYLQVPGRHKLERLSANLDDKGIGRAINNGDTVNV